MLQVREFAYVGSCLLLSVGLVVVIYIIHGQQKPENNGFRRNLRIGLTPINEFDLGYNSFYLAGCDTKRIYLGNSTATTLLLKVDHALRDTTHSWLFTRENLTIRQGAARLYADSANVYVMDGITPNFLHASLNTLQLTSLENDAIHFSIAMPLSKASYVVRAFDTQKQQYILTKKRTRIPHKSETNPILEKQQDGRFSVDGILSYNSKAAVLTYVYYYRNEFITLDTSLNILYKANTIDTITTAQIKTAKLNTKTGTKYVLAAPASEVNKNSFLSNERIYINSARKADNEDISTFKNSSVIDVYLLKDGRYEFSFYLENYKGHKPSSMIVYNDTLVAVFGNYMRTYNLDFALPD